MPGVTSRPLPVLGQQASSRADLTRVPLIGRFLRWKHARTTLQIPLLLLAAVIIADGLLGPGAAPENAAGVAPWVQWRGLVVLALLMVGNLFCMACPFMLPRRLAKRLLPGERNWPAWLKGKWVALALLVLFFWAYEAFDLWASPWLTAWVILAYFAAAFVVDGFFKGAAFCKYACPIGSFNFVNALTSPAEVAVRDADICASCETKDCIAGRYEPAPAGPPTPTHRTRFQIHNSVSAENQAGAKTVAESVTGGRNGTGTTGSGPKVESGTWSERTGGEPRRLLQSGCELWLFQPRKVGNMDCTFCLDCIQACPHENVGIIARVPGRELVGDRWRSGIGRFSERPDLLALAMVVVFGAFANAAGMVAPMARVQDGIGRVLGTTNEVAIWTAFLFGALFVVPSMLLIGTSWLSRLLATAAGQDDAGVAGTRTVLLRLAWGLVPLGFGMWLAHYAFHFLAGGLALVPALQRAAVDMGLRSTPPDWSLGALVPESWLLPLELVLLEAGLLGSLVLCYYISRATFGTARRAYRGFAPWALLAVALAASGAWLMTQPMAMRGMRMPGTEMPGMEMSVMERTGAPGDTARVVVASTMEAGRDG